MSHFVQLLGSDVPDSHGGCCYYGSMFSQLWEPASQEEPLPSSQPGARSTKETNLFDVYEKEEEGYLCFNCPEGTQRFSSEAGIRLTRVRCFCFTRFGRNAKGVEERVNNCSSNTESEMCIRQNVTDKGGGKGACSAWMGLPGLLFTINDAGASQAHFMGPSSARCTPMDVEELCGVSCANVSFTSECHDNTRTSSTRLMMQSLRVGNRDCVQRVNYFNEEKTTIHRSDSTEAEQTTQLGTTANASPTCVSAVHFRAGRITSGVEKFLHALQAHYFRHRRMTFFQVQPFTIRGTVLGGSARVGASHSCPTDAKADSIDGRDEARTIHSGCGHTNRVTTEDHRAYATYDHEEEDDDFLSLLPLSAHSFLLRIRTSPKIKREASSGEEVYSYIIVEAPQGTFDATLAKKCGVRPGPKYGMLKHGHEVEADMDEGNASDVNTTSTLRCKRARSVSGGEGTEETPLSAPDSVAPTRRIVYPHEVMRRTKASTRLYLSFIFDSDSMEDLQHALQKLFGICKNGISLFTHVLQRYLPSMLYVADGVTAEKGDGERMWTGSRSSTSLVQRERRRLVVRHMVHLQPVSYFLRWRKYKIEMETVFEHYIQDLLKPLQGVIPKAECCESDLNSSHCFLPSDHQPVFHFQDSDRMESESNCPVSRHLFTAYVYRFFTAFPTALVHRYHLHLLAPSLFPVHVPRTHEEDHRGQCQRAVKESSTPHVTYWPYSFKFRCIPEEGRQNQSSSQNKKAIYGQNGGKMPNALIDDVVRLIRYPTYSSSTDLLSPQLRERILASHRQMASKSRSISLGSDEKGVESCWSLNSALVFMGTGSAVPSKYRNVSGTYIQLNLPHRCFPTSKRTTELKDNSLRRVVVVLDWGEGSCGQLHRLLGGDDLNHMNEEEKDASNNGNTPGQVRGEEMYLNHNAEIDTWDNDAFVFHPSLAAFLRDVEIVFLSHAHADHHLGIISLIELRHQLYSRHPEYAAASHPLTVVCPTEVYEWMCDSWFSTEPYASYVFEECEFDILPSQNDAYARRRTGTEEKETDFCEVKPIPFLEKRLERWNTALKLYSSSTDETSISPSWGAETFTVVHPANAHALLLRFPVWDIPCSANERPEMDNRHPSFTSKVLLFSGDTRPCQSLVQRTSSFLRRGVVTHSVERKILGRGDPVSLVNQTSERETTELDSQRLFICLHEATFGPGFEMEAMKKCHSTLGEALSIGMDALDAQFVVLNHFSQRYPKIPDISSAASSFSSSSSTSCSCPDNKEETVTKVTAEQLSQRLSFAFDSMFLSFKALYSEDMKNFLPLSLQLLDEYASWEQGTTARMREDHSKNRKKI